MGFLRSLFSFIVLFSCLITVYGQGTRVGFYSATCPNAEAIVRTTVTSHFSSDPKIAPGLLRMHFHDCFVQGCDASVLIAGPNTERTAGANFNLRGFEVIDDAKKQLEAACPGVVSCADILTLAARDSVALTKGQSWQVPTGRRDGRVSLAANVNNLPSPSDSVAIQQRKFSAFRLNTRDMVALVGGHTIGTVACGFFTNRIFNSSGNTADPTMDQTFVPQLQRLCPQNGDGSNRVALDFGGGNTFDTSFFNNLSRGRGILQSDHVLWTNPTTRQIVQEFMASRRNFNAQFASSMIKMSNIGVKTGTNGEIRRVCTAIN